MNIKMNEGDSVLSITKFYEMVSEKMGVTLNSNSKFDCSKIEVSKTVADELESYYVVNNVEGFAFAMIWLQYGPKVNEMIEDYEVVVDEGFISE